MKILVAIANYGTKNRGFLDQLLAEYRSMPWEIHIVVLSDRPKDDLGEDVEVLVGTPSEDPWSLPFAHRKLFVDRREDFDLFIYSEDDTLLTEENLKGWMEVQPLLPENQIAGFLRYEIFGDGALSYCGVHYHYHWDPERTESHGGEAFAHFTNEHSALCVLNKEQLGRCIDSGGYAVDPHQGRYDMLVSAASDPYTQCGLQRMICISRLPDFLLRHLPNVYLGRIGIHEDDFLPQIAALKSIATGESKGQSLFDPVVRLDVDREAWNKVYYTAPERTYRTAFDWAGKRVLSVGVGDGSLEADWVAEGASVTAIPMDAAIGAMAARKGLEVLEPSLESALQSLAGKTFDRIVFHHTLEHVSDPSDWLKRLSVHLESDGQLVVWAANQPGRRMRFRVRKEAYPLTPQTPFGKSNYHFTNPAVMRAWLQAAGLQPVSRKFILRNKAERVAKYGLGLFDFMLADAFLQVASKS